jgi:hypothetical protein
MITKFAVLRIEHDFIIRASYLRVNLEAVLVSCVLERQTGQGKCSQAEETHT